MFTALPAIALLAVLGALLAISHRNGSADDRREESREVANAAALNARGYLDDRFDVLAAVSVQPASRATLKASAAASGFDNLGTIDRHGRTVISTSLPSGAPPLDVSDRAYVQAALAGRTAVSDVLDSRVSGRPVLAIGYPVSDGLVAGGLLLDQVGAVLRRLLFSPGAGVTVIDGAGNVVVGARPVRGLQPAPAAYPLASMRRSGAGTVRSRDQLLGYHTVRGTGWLVVVAQDYGAVIGPLNRALWLEIGALALFALVGVFITFASARRFDRLDREREDALAVQREIALTLQRSLLPDLVVPDSVMVSAHYVPAQGVVAVGGDWYDLVDIGDGRVAFDVGDVAGHGLEAAVTMGKLRSAARVAGLEGSSPVAALTALDRFATSIASRPLATVAYAVLDPATGVLRYALAGHPPPLLIRADGSANYLEGGRSPLLGVPPVSPRAEAEVTLAPGDVLVVYTDGLVERPEASIDEGMAALAKRAAGLVGDIPSMADRLLATVTEPRRDDAAVLVVALQPSSVAS